MKEHMEEIKTYMGGVIICLTFFMEDIKKKDLLKKYIEIAPR